LGCFRKDIMKTIDLLLGQPVTFVIQLIGFDIRIFQQGIDVNIRKISFQILHIAFDNAAIVYVGIVVPHGFRYFLMRKRMRNLIRNFEFSIMYSLYSRA